jgi:hypothetical protein
MGLIIGRCGVDVKGVEEFIPEGIWTIIRKNIEELPPLKNIWLLFMLRAWLCPLFEKNDHEV